MHAAVETTAPSPCIPTGELAIVARGLGKCYEIYAKPRDRLLQSIFRGRRQFFQPFWAVTGISFEVRRGETVGIVGRNGSGKSTLLQLVAGTLTPTAGTVTVHGRVAALLELGSGFNPEYTGRENIFLNGSVLGFSRAAMMHRYPEILAFADIGEFVDQPVKTYSSGMLARLAFAVAIHADPELLIVDETLSVGDEAFQRKCFARIHELRERGTSILFVSHAAAAIVELCDRAILLDHGELLYAGRPKDVVGLYQKLIYAPPDRAAAVRRMIVEGEQRMPATSFVALQDTGASDATAGDADFDPTLVPQSTIAYENRGAEIDDPHIETRDGRRVNVLAHGEEYVFTYRVRFATAAGSVTFGMGIRNITGVGLGGGTSAPPDEAIPHVAARSHFRVAFRFRCLLNADTYFLNAGVLGAAGEGLGYLDRRLDVAMFRVKIPTRTVATGAVDFHIVPSVENVV